MHVFLKVTDLPENITLADSSAVLTVECDLECDELTSENFPYVVGLAIQKLAEKMEPRIAKYAGNA